MTVSLTRRISFTWVKRNAGGWLPSARVIALRYNWPFADDSANLTLRVSRENGCEHYKTLSVYWNSKRFRVNLNPTLYWRKTRQAKALERLMRAAVERDLNRPPEPFPFEHAMRFHQQRRQHLLRATP